jgi:ketosteroid isomerase-like protein
MRSAGRLVALSSLLVAMETTSGQSLRPEDRVREIEDARLRAVLAADMAALGQIFHPEAVYTHGSGRSQSGADYLGFLARGELRYLQMRREFPPTVRFPRGDLAVVHSRVTLVGQTRHGPAKEQLMSVLTVYAETGIGWQLVAQQNTPAAPAPTPTLLSRHVAVTGVCAWPKLVCLPDNTLVTAIYDQPSHGNAPGDVAIWASIDGGRSWQFRGRATRHEGNQAWFNHALGLAANGDLLVASSGWNFHDDRPAKHNVPLRTRVSRSNDGGRTWRDVGEFPPAPEPGRELIPFGKIERGDDGVIRIAAYSFARGLPGPRVDVGYIVSSWDDATTWHITAKIGEPEVNETDLLHLGGGRWLAAARNLERTASRNTHSIDLYRSDDNAATWRRDQRLTAPRQHPGHLLLLADGRVLLTYGDRRPASFGVNAMLGCPDGATWSPEFRLVDGLSDGDSGYPATAQLADGTLVTLYYARGAVDHSGYHLGVVRWRLP